VFKAKVHIICKRPLAISILASVLCLLLLLLQISIGFGPGQAHVDESTYLNPAAFDAARIGRFYFYYAWVLDYKVERFIIVNQVFYFLTSYLMALNLNKINCLPTLKLLLLFLIFDPLRMHFSVHVLKESMIIFFLIFLVNKNYRWILSVLLAIFLRLYFVGYMLAFEKPTARFLTFLIISSAFAFLSILIFLDHLPTAYVELLLGVTDGFPANEIFHVPEFKELGFWGAVLRVFVWPFITITGLNMAFAESLIALAFIPIIFGTVVTTFFIRKNLFLIGPFVVAVAGLSYLVPHYDSFIRYCYPLLCVYPFLALRRRRYRLE